MTEEPNQGKHYHYYLRFILVTSTKRKNDAHFDDLYEGMKRLKTEDVHTKRFLLALHCCTQREVTLKKGGDIVFGRHLK
jgi:hypothetical protein